MKHLKEIKVYAWSANHVAIQLKETKHKIKPNGKVKIELDDFYGKPIKQGIFKAVTHDSDSKRHLPFRLYPSALDDILETYLENKRVKEISIIDDYWEDCSQYIRDDQKEILLSTTIEI